MTIKGGPSGPEQDGATQEEKAAHEAKKAEKEAQNLMPSEQLEEKAAEAAQRPMPSEEEKAQKPAQPKIVSEEEKAEKAAQEQKDQRLQENAAEASQQLRTTGPSAAQDMLETIERLQLQLRHQANVHQQLLEILRQLPDINCCTSTCSATSSSSAARAPAQAPAPAQAAPAPAATPQPPLFGAIALKPTTPLPRGGQPVARLSNGCARARSVAEFVGSTNDELWKRAWDETIHTKGPENGNAYHDATTLWRAFMTYRDDTKQYHQDQQEAALENLQQQHDRAWAAANAPHTPGPWPTAAWSGIEQQLQRGTAHEEGPAAATGQTWQQQPAGSRAGTAAIVPAYFYEQGWSPPTAVLEEEMASAEQSAWDRQFDLACLPPSVRPAGKSKNTYNLWCTECKCMVAWVRRTEGAYDASQDGGCSHFSGRQYRTSQTIPLHDVQ